MVVSKIRIYLSDKDVTYKYINLENPSDFRKRQLNEWIYSFDNNS